MLCNYFHSILFPYSKTVIVNGSYHVTKYYNMIGPHVVCLCVTCSSMRIKGGRTGEGTGRGWHGTPRRFLRGVSASTCFTAAGALFRHSWLIKEESASWSLHWLASKLKTSGYLCLWSRFSERGRMKWEPGERGWYLDPLVTPRHQVQYELVLWWCCRLCSSKFWSKNCLRSNLRALRKNFSGKARVQTLLLAPACIWLYSCAPPSHFQVSSATYRQ